MSAMRKKNQPGFLKLQRIHHMQQQLWQRYQHSLWHSIEKLLLCCVVAGFFLLIAAQIVLKQQDLRQELQIGDSWYGQEYQPVLPAAADDTELWGNITLALVDYESLPEALVLVNGEISGRFQNRTVTVRVHPGDQLAVDTTAYRLPIQIRISSASSNINTSFLQETVRLQQEQLSLGNVIFR